MCLPHRQAQIYINAAAPNKPRLIRVLVTDRCTVIGVRPRPDPGRGPFAAGFPAKGALERLRIFVDSYGLEREDRARFIEVLLQAEHVATRFMDGRAAAGELGFAVAWHDAAKRRFADKISWIERNASILTEALLLED